MKASVTPCYNGGFVIEFMLSMLAVSACSSALRRHCARDPRTASAGRRAETSAVSTVIDRLFWTVLRSSWSRWREVLVIVTPERVIAWHRAGFHLYWRWRSRRHGGRPKITEEIRELIRRMADENTGWGAPKIHGELQKVGFVVSERTIGRYLRRMHRRSNGTKRWPAFLQNTETTKQTDA
jgi:hypothetical protein